MTLQDINIKTKIGSKSNQSANPKKEDKGSVIGGLAGTALAAMPFIPKKFKIMAGVAFFFLLYGVGNFLYDIISLF